VSVPPPFTEQTFCDSEELPQGFRPRSPMAVVTLSLMAGILVDRWLGMDVAAWVAIALGGLLLAWLMRRRSLRIVTLSLLIAGASIGGLRHHLGWSVVAGDDISLLVQPEPTLVHVVGIVDTPIVIVGADDSVMTPVWMQVDRSMCDLRCEVLVTDALLQPVSGTVRLLVSGHLLHVDVGDRVEVLGRLITPRGPTNPGGFDYREYLQGQGVRALIECNHPDAVRLRAPQVADHFQRWRSRLRQECERTFAAHLDERTAPLASSLLLGERSGLPTDVRDAFVQSGTMHLLAISGLHVGILAGLLLVVCRLLNLPVAMITIVVLLGVGVFACITNLRPPVVRASVLATVVAAGWPMYRSAGAVNLVAVCGLVVLLIDPTDLFDTGTQLSFLAVMAIVWSADFIARQRRRVDEESLLPRLFARRPGVAASLVRFLAEGYVVTASIWLFTLPLTMAQFHVAAPVGFAINVLLIPWVAVVLGMGFTTMAVGLLLPWVVAIPAALFDWSLRALLSVVDATSALDLGHTHLAGPTIGWLGVFYALLAAVLLLSRWGPVRRWGWSAVWGWVIAGQVAALLPAERVSLRCTILDVGHGCCVVLQLPGGETLLYDAGMLAGEQRGRQIIQSGLWELGVRQIDGIIVSHADIDHFNAVAGLMETMPVSTLLCSRTFLDFEQQSVEAACEAARDAGVPIKLLHAGDRLILQDEQMAIRILHPSDDWRSEHDNANSLVLSVEFGGRTMLLTGDLERDGLQRLMAATPFSTGTDVLLAPHHGSRLSNPRSFAEWASPRSVIVSGGNAPTGGILSAVYDSAERLLTTHSCGAVSVEIHPDGALQITPFLDQSDNPGKMPM
jgi:competence protein ComEC